MDNCLDIPADLKRLSACRLCVLMGLTVLLLLVSISPRWGAGVAPPILSESQQ